MFVLKIDHFLHLRDEITEERKISNIQTKGLIFSAQKMTKAIVTGNTYWQYWQEQASP